MVGTAPRWPGAHLLWLALALVAATVARPRAAHAQTARASFFLQMLRQNPEARVRLSAALRLSDLREADTVEPLMQVYAAERDSTVQAAILSAFASIGDARALPVVQSAARSPNRDVATQARRAMNSLQGAAAAANPPPTAGGAARFLIGLGTVNNQAGSGGPQLTQIAHQALESAISQRPQAVLNAGNASQAQAQIRARHLAGHFFDANIQSLQPRGSGVRASVSIAVSTYPGRVYEFESQTAITITGGSGDSQSTAEDAVRRAVESAANHAIDQLMNGGGS